MVQTAEEKKVANRESHRRNYERKSRLKQTPEEKREHGRKYRETHREQISANKRKWHEANLEHVHNKQLEYREMNRAKACETAREWREEHPEQSRNLSLRYQKAHPEWAAKRNLKHTYGLTDEEVERLYTARQTGVCAICGEEMSLVIDHDHTTGEVCGILCRKCNLGLGHFNDDPTLLRKATEYAEKTRTNTS